MLQIRRFFLWFDCFVTGFGFGFEAYFYPLIVVSASIGFLHFYFLTSCMACSQCRRNRVFVSELECRQTKLREIHSSTRDLLLTTLYRFHDYSTKTPPSLSQASLPAYLTLNSTAPDRTRPLSSWARWRSFWQVGSHGQSHLLHAGLSHQQTLRTHPSNLRGLSLDGT